MYCPLMNARDCNREKCAIWVEDTTTKEESEEQEIIIPAHCGLIARPCVEIVAVNNGITTKKVLA